MKPTGWDGAGAHVLVVDDQEPNRLLLRELLEGHGCRISEAANGEAAVEAARQGSLDIILLDVNMPGMDGIEACRQLKADPATAAIPLILVTALAQREDRLRGIDAGANDYVTKPFDTAELGLRIHNALILRRLHAHSEQQYLRLKELESLRDGLVHMLVHDLRTPLTGIKLYLEMIRSDVGAMAEAGEAAELVDEADAITVRMTEMINDMLDTSRLEAGVMPLERQSANMDELVRQAIGLVGARGRKREVDFVAGAGTTVVCDPDVIRRVLANLVANAVDFSPEGRPVRVRVAREDGQVRVLVSDDGPGIPAEYHERIFDKFGQIEATRNNVKHSSGLGLTFCKLAVGAHGGTIGVDSEPGQGSTFWFVLPLAPGPTAG